MEVSLQTAENAVALQFETVTEVENFFDDVKSQLGFYIQLNRELKQYQRFVFTAIAPPRFEFSFEAEVIQVVPGADGWGTAFQLCWQPGKSEELDSQLKGKKSTRRGQEDVSVNSPLFKIRNMNPNERFRLAIKASRTERQILLRDSSPQVLLGLLAHPRIENKEVLELVKSTHATGAMMERVAGNRKWMSNQEIQLAIVKSPKTAPPLAIKLLETSRIQDLRMLAKSGNVREQVRRAALRVYLKRSGKK